MKKPTIAMAEEPPEFVLDASALLAYLQDETGADVVQLVVDRSAVSTPNWSEVCQRLLARHVDIDDLRAEIEALGVELAAFTADDAELAASLALRTRNQGLSLGDRACLSLARRLGVPALTADHAWLGLDLGIEVRSIR